MQALCSSLIRRVKKSQKRSERCESPNRWFTLPREIRDMVYREVLRSEYLIHWSVRWKRGKAAVNVDRPLFWFRGTHYFWTGVFWSGHVWMKKKLLYWADISLLLTSKAISQEAIDIMYEESLFCVYMIQQSIPWYPVTPLPAQYLLDRMQNIKMSTCVCHTLDYTASETWFAKFNGGRTKRNTCHISFPCYYCLVWCEDHTPFFRAAQFLVGFETVLVTLELRFADDDSEEFEEVYSAMRGDFKVALEPCLGPGESYDIDFNFCLEFHPRKHLEDVQAALLNSEEQALALADETEPVAGPDARAAKS